MLRTNLSTRPFYNERAVRTGLGAVALLALALTIFNALEVIRLRSQSSDARQTIAQNEITERELREKARVVRLAIDRTKLDAVQNAAREANALIDRRTFSWTELLNLFQSTLPPDVRITGVMPQTDHEGRRLVQISVFERRIEDLEAFMDALEKTGAFSGVLSRTDRPVEGGSIESQVQAYYLPVDTGAAGEAPASSESGKAPVKGTPPGKGSAVTPQ
jgi:hypothetical protein